jgi:hypothetical protein
MKITRRFTLPAHGVVELIAGIAMILAPAVLSFGPGALIVSAGLGAILMGNALNLTAHSSNASIASRSSASVACHSSFDSAFLVVTALAALVFAVAGQANAVVFLAAIVVLQAILGFSTRYTIAE